VTCETVSRPDERPGHEETAWLVPNGAVTGVGSLPTTDPGEALEFVAAHAPLIPFCPQPPATDLLADTLDQQLESTSWTDPWLEHFAEAVGAGAFPRALALKSQITGPITLAGLLRVGQRGHSGPELVDDLAAHVAGRAARQARQLRSFGLPVLITVDEPALVLLGPRDGVALQLLFEGIFRRIRCAGARTGIHCCATTHPAWLGSFDCDVISFDASQDVAPSEDDALVLDAPDRIIAFGLVGASPAPDSAGDAFSRWLTASAMVADPADLAARTVLTPRCGLGRSNLAEAEATFGAVSAVSELVGRFARSH
jgi:hypothetical protein